MSATLPGDIRDATPLHTIREVPELFGPSLLGWATLPEKLQRDHRDLNLADVLRIQKSLQAEIEGQARPEHQHHERGKQGPRKESFPKPEGVFLVCSFIGDAQTHEQESRRDQVGPALQRLRQKDDAPGNDHRGYIESNVSQIHQEGGEDRSFGGNLGHDFTLS
mgnify:CR=1 FL=1